MEQFVNRARTTFAASAAAVAAGTSEVIEVTSVESLPTGPVYRLVAKGEIMLVTAVNGTNLTVTRGVEGSAPVAHNAGDALTHVLTKGALQAYVGAAAAGEQARAESAETVLAGAVVTERTRAEVAESAKASSAALATETGARAAGDTAERTRAEAAEGAKATTTALATETTAREAGDAIETTRAQAAEATKAQGLTPTAVKTAAYAVVAGDYVRVDISAGSVPSTLPTEPPDKTRVGVKIVKVSGTPGSTTATVVCGGTDVFNVMGGSTTLTLTALFQSAILQYQASGKIWTVQTTDTPLGSALGAAKLGTDGTVGGPSGSALSPSVVTGSNVAFAMTPEQLISGAITRSATGAALEASVVWPDGATGTYKGTESTTTPGAIDSYKITHVLGEITKTYTQSTMTRNSEGAVVTRPAITVV
jgi:hypothetical protein